MVMTLQPDNSLRPYRVLRAMWFMGRVCAVGDQVLLPRSTAAELQAAGKLEPAPAEVPAAPQAEHQAEPDTTHPPAAGRKGGKAGGKPAKAAGDKVAP